MNENLNEDFFPNEIIDRSTPVNKFFLDNESSLFEFEQNEKLAEAESTRNSAILHFKDPIDQLEKMIQNINSSNLDCTLESLIAPQEDDDLENRLESEIKKRVFLETKINELNLEKIGLGQKLAITEDKLIKKELILKNFECNLSKTVEKWKNKELEFLNIIEKVKSEKQTVSIELTKMNMRNQLIEQEIKKIGDDLIAEKVKGQEYQNQISGLQKSIANHESHLKQKESQIEDLNSKIEILEQKKATLEDELINLKSELEKAHFDSQNYKNKLDNLSEKNQNLGIQYDSLKVEYENLINEAKSVIEESERQYNHLTKTIESEKLKKDTLQVEMNMLEEKYENKIKLVVAEYESKVNIAKNFASEKEKSLIESHKAELDQLKAKAQYDIDKIKYKMSEDFKEKSNDYESKILNLNLKIDTLQNEITRLEAVNYDLENERNTIRRNLKQQLEIQMKETFELLGLENDNSTKFKRSNSINGLQKISKLESASCLSLANINRNNESKLNTSLQCKSYSPVVESSLNSTKATVKEDLEEKPIIKDTFIINQIDLINKYYQIDNSAIKAAGVVAVSNNNLFEEINVTCTSSPKKQETKSDKNTSINSSRSSELKHYIELLLNKQPSVVDNDKEGKNMGYNDLSDIELGYTKKQSNDYYDDVKRNLNFDSSESEDDSYDDTENSLKKQPILNKKKLSNKPTQIIKNSKNRK